MRQARSIPDFGLFGEVGLFPDVVHVEAFSARAPLHDWTISAHRHGRMAQIFRIDRGSVSASTDRQKWQLSDQSILFIPAMCVHQFDFEPDTEGQVYSIPNTLLENIGPNGQAVRGALAYPFRASLNGTLIAILDALAEVFHGSHIFRREQAVALVHSALTCAAEVAVEAKETTTASAKVEQFDQLVSKHAQDNWSASQYASELGTTTGHLSRLCKAASGFGATAYLERKLMGEACQLLAFTRLPVSAVGYRVGFNDPSYFSKRFSKVCGETPSAYRRRFVES